MKWSISLVYTKSFPEKYSIKTETLLRVLITNANSEEEALGKGIKHFEGETKGFVLLNKVSIQIAESESEHIEQPSDIVTDEEIDKAWENANFGDISKRKVILESLEKCVQGYRTGRTAECIVTELALVAEWHLTEKGLRYLKAAFKSQSPKQ